MAPRGLALLLCALTIRGEETCDSGNSSKRGQAMLQRVAAKPSVAMAPPVVSPSAVAVGVALRSLSLRARALQRAAESGRREVHAALGPARTSAAGIDKLILEFIKDQSNSQDKCPAKLIESKRQLREIRVHMYKIALEINTTSRDVKTSADEVDEMQKGWQTVQDECGEEQAQCGIEHNDYKQQWEVLQWELQIMRQMADPEVTIKAEDMTYHAWAARHMPREGFNGASKIAEYKDNGVDHSPLYAGSASNRPAWWPAGSSLLDAATVPAAGGSLLKTHAPPTKVPPSSKDVQSAAQGVEDLKATSDEVKKCEVSSVNAPLSEHCKELMKIFETSYYTSYSKVTRLITEFEILVNSTACHDKVEQSCKEKREEAHEKTTKAGDNLKTVTQRLMTVKEHITGLSKAEKLLVKHIRDLDTACGEMDNAAGNLAHVREALHNLGDAAGRLTRVNFHIPKYTGEFVTDRFNSIEKTDAALDAEMNALCEKFSKDGMPARAAEVSEIMQQSVEDMPIQNPSNVPLLGTCPHCKGERDASDGERHKSGHFRNCWDGDAVLDGHTVRSDCGSQSFKVVLCVWDTVLGSNLRDENENAQS